MADTAERVAAAQALLTDREREVLAFERQWWKYAGAKEQAIKELFDMSGTRYYQVLNALIDNPAALEADPMLIKRLRRLRASRQRQRSARRVALERPEPHASSADPAGPDRPGGSSEVCRARDPFPRSRPALTRWPGNAERAGRPIATDPPGVFRCRDYFFGLSTNQGMMWSKVTTLPMPVATMKLMP